MASVDSQHTQVNSAHARGTDRSSAAAEFQNGSYLKNTPQINYSKIKNPDNIKLDLRSTLQTPTTNTFVSSKSQAITKLLSHPSLATQGHAGSLCICLKYILTQKLQELPLKST